MKGLSWRVELDNSDNLSKSKPTRLFDTNEPAAMTIRYQLLSDQARRAVLDAAAMPLSAEGLAALCRKLSSATLCLPHAPCTPHSVAGLLQRWSDLRPLPRSALQRALAQFCMHLPAATTEAALLAEPAASPALERPSAQPPAPDSIPPTATSATPPTAVRRARRDWFDRLVDGVAALLG